MTAQLPADVLAKSGQDSDEVCYKCDRVLTVAEVVADKCQGCGAKPSANPDPDDLPF
jgi:hypothetical protein